MKPHGSTTVDSVRIWNSLDHLPHCSTTNMYYGDDNLLLFPKYFTQGILKVSEYVGDNGSSPYTRQWAYFQKLKFSCSEIW